MRVKEYISVFLLFLLITAIFFYKSFLHQSIPLPVDSLVGNFAPYNSLSLDGYTPGGVPNKAQGSDVIRQLYPWKDFVIKSFQAGFLPLWNPYNLSGNPMLANFQTGAFYPLNILFFFFSFTNAWTLYIFSIPVLSGFFTYLFLRGLKISMLASIFSGLVYAFSSYMVVWMEWGNIGHTFLWLPLAISIVDKLVRRFQVLYFLSLLIVLWFSLLGGYIQGYFYICLVLTVYFIGKSILEKSVSPKRSAVFLLALVLPVLLSLFQILPTIELFQNSSRSNYSLKQIGELLNPFWYFITTIAPDFFGNPASRNYWFAGTYIERVSYFGLIPIILAIFALSSYKQKKETILFGFLCMLSLLFATNILPVRYFYTLPSPLLSTVVPTRILSVFIFSGSVLSGFGFDLFLERKEKKKLLLSTLLFVSILGIAWLLVFFLPKMMQKDWVSYLSVSRRNLILPTFLSVVFLAIVLIATYTEKFPWKKHIHMAMITGVFLLTLFDLFYFFHKITPFSKKTYIYPETPVVSFIKKNAGYDRFWGYGSGYMAPNFQTFERIYYPDGYEPLHVKRYGELLSSSKNGEIAKNILRSDAGIAPGFGAGDMEKNPYRQKILNLLGVKYILHKTSFDSLSIHADTAIFPEDTYKLIWQEGEWQIYENKKVLPRVFLAESYNIVPEKEQIIAQLFDKGFNPLQTLLLEKAIPNTFTLKKDLKAKVWLTEYSPNKVSVTAQSATDTLLFLSDTYYPGWRVQVDGKPATIYRADYAFRAVPIEKGKHTILFFYEPQSFTAGLRLSIFFMIIVLVTTALLRKKNRHV